MSSPPNPISAKASDNMRLPAYRASYLGRYHPYPRTRAPAREVVMSAAENEPSEESSPAENVSTVGDLRIQSLIQRHVQVYAVLI
ncbi:hypothetical protein BC826DRAFT_1015033 [Russula brevipes]|nr:hypothetical protein BC826DRAFT_1015033 [Russula brevipes]